MRLYKMLNLWQNRQRTLASIPHHCKLHRKFHRTLYEVFKSQVEANVGGAYVTDAITLPNTSTQR
jgi:hypothetical protein